MKLFDAEDAFQVTIKKGENGGKADGDYYGADGLLHCGKCGSRKQREIKNSSGGTTIVPAMCQCHMIQYRKMQQEQAAYEEANRIRRLPINEIQNPGTGLCTFEAATKNKKNIEKCKRYADAWPEMIKNNIGLLLWGCTGTGKSFAASAIANYLRSKFHVNVLNTSFDKYIAAVTGRASDGKIEYLRSVDNFQLVVFDDLGAERQSEYAQEQVYSIINQRYASKLPTIITTNLTLEELKKPKNIDCARIYDRILEMCVPMHFAGESLRKETAQRKLEIARKILNESEGLKNE